MSPVTVLMRTKNSGDILDQTLKALFSQDFKDFKLVVVDSGSTDETLAILRHYPCDVSSIKAEEYFPGNVLNQAISKISSLVVVFLNSDTVLLTPSALSHLVHAFDDASVQAAFGRQLARPDAKPWVVRDYLASFPNESTSPPWMHLSLPFAGMRRSIWQKRPFYTKAWGSEDTEWGYWAKQSGLTIRYVPEALVMHSHNYTLRQLYGRRFIEGEADAFIFRNSYSFLRMFIDFTKATIRDLYFYSKRLSFQGIPMIPIRRLVYYWAYYRGHALGRRRISTGDQDSSQGQKEVLKRY